jgi:hypothetical protein
MDHLQPGEYVTGVDVKTEQPTDKGNRPLSGGYGSQATAHTFLYYLTGDAKYIRPFTELFEKGQDTWPARRFVPELWRRGALDTVAQQARESVLRGHKVTAAIALGDKKALCDALKADIAELQRFKTMYTDAEVFTDRVFLDSLTNAALCYTGGFATRNKYNQTHAASWEGFGTDYAALVLLARRDHFKTLVYNFRSTPMTGKVRLWTLDHGRYRLTLGTDADGDDKADKAPREETIEVGRATGIALILPPRTVVVLELHQVEKSDDLLSRPDLALSTRELHAKDGVLTGVVHNIGAKEAANVTVALIDASGKARERRNLGLLPAPLDLEPKRAPFHFENIGKDLRGWKVVVDPENQVPEIFEENNVAVL